MAAVAFTLVTSVAGYAATLNSNCAGGGAPPCNDQTTSLGKFLISVAAPFQPMFTGMPGYDATDHIFVSPLLSDQNTVIGRSSSFGDGSANDTTNPIQIGAGSMALTGTGDPSVVPSGFPTGNDEIHTAILSMDLQGGGFQVLAGSNAQAVNASVPNSFGEVEAGQNSADFPAKSFFDVFVEIEIPGLGTAHNDTALVVQNGDITSLPPHVIYTHGGSVGSVNIVLDSGPFSGDILGTFLLTGHGVSYTPGQAGVFNNQFDQLVDTAGFSPAVTGRLHNALGLPEPGTWMMLLGGLGLVGTRRLRRGN
jgi:hypothetical protein